MSWTASLNGDKTDHPSRLVSRSEFADIAGRVVAAANDGEGFGCLIYLGVHEMHQLVDSFGKHAQSELAAQLEGLVLNHVQPSGTAAYDGKHRRFIFLLPGATSEAIAERFNALSREIAARTFRVGAEPVRLTPIVGLVEFPTDANRAELQRRAEVAVAYADTRLDLLVVRYASISDQQRQPRWTDYWIARLKRLRIPLQIVLALLAPIAVPLAVYIGLESLGWNVVPIVYFLIVAVLFVTAVTIWIEGFYALRRVPPPDEPATPYPPASAIIAAYLPNEDATIIQTIEAFLRLHYPETFQVILAYNTPVNLPVEEALYEIAERDPRFLPLRVDVSTSKAQNINAALSEVTGEFIGVFDADHQPDPGSFRRAWRWLSNGYDIVQGHCLIRNGDASWVARMVSVEFEALYAVSHPGRARFHRFGIFGGSNGYWKTDLLQKIRMREFMLTEDIDSTIRALDDEANIVADPRLISRELGPATLRALWHQRMRWKQGWFQVSLRHLRATLDYDHFNLRQKLGMVYLLGWSQVYPWLALQIFPILIFWSFKFGFENLEWLIPIFILTTLFTLSSGPGKTIFAYLVADPEIRRRRHWFLLYLFMESLFYTPFKNLITRIAQVREMMGEAEWKITPRARTES